VNATAQIKGWCPSAWRPMLSGDGYLVRLRFSCGILSSDEARGIASLAQRYGSGLIDLTRRANVQIRGVSEKQIPGLQAELLARNLIAPDAGDIPAVIASPLAGRDRDALADIRPLVRELEARLAADPRARDLPAKFCIAITDGGSFPLHDLSSDIAFEGCEQDRAVGFAVRIADRDVVGSVAAEEIADTALAIAAAFTRLSKRSSGRARRMADLVEEIGVNAIVQSCPGLGVGSASAKGAGPVPDGGACPGEKAVGLIAADVFGVAAAFGSLHADQLALLSDLAEHHAVGELRLTPWRAVLIPAIAPGAVGSVEAECARAGLITDRADRRRHVAACPGAPACSSASVATRHLATVLGPLLGPRDTLHVSGCSKGCASSAASSVTLIGRDGCFDLVRSGRVADTPVLFGLSAEGACLALKRIAAQDSIATQDLIAAEDFTATEDLAHV
jgi:precorrin-3B synthase